MRMARKAAIPAESKTKRKPKTVRYRNTFSLCLCVQYLGGQKCETTKHANNEINNEEGTQAYKHLHVLTGLQVTLREAGGKAEGVPPRGDALQKHFLAPALILWHLTWWAIWRALLGERMRGGAHRWWRAWGVGRNINGMTGGGEDYGPRGRRHAVEMTSAERDLNSKEKMHKLQGLTERCLFSLLSTLSLPTNFDSLPPAPR